MSETSPDDGFVSLLVAHQGRIYRFLCTLVPRREDAEDLLKVLRHIRARLHECIRKAVAEGGTAS